MTMYVGSNAYGNVQMLQCSFDIKQRRKKHKHTNELQKKRNKQTNLQKKLKATFSFFYSVPTSLHILVSPLLHRMTFLFAAVGLEK